MIPIKILIVVTTLSLLFCISTGEDLTAVKCKAKLPRPRSSIAHFYDGKDTVYLFGGSNFYRVNETLKYSISDDTLEPAGELPKDFRDGNTLSDSSGNIYYLGGMTTAETGDIYQYHPDNQTFSDVSYLPEETYWFETIQPEPDNALIFGGRYTPHQVLSVDLKTWQFEKVGEMPKGNSSYRCVLWVEEKQTAYIFDGVKGYENITKYNRTSGEFDILPNYFPDMFGHCKCVWDGRYGYLIAGFLQEERGYPHNNILQFDPETEDIKFISVADYPGWRDSAFFDTAAVYVEKLNRIYLFGGYTLNESFRWREEILYISLDPLSQHENKF